MTNSKVKDLLFMQVLLLDEARRKIVIIPLSLFPRKL